MPNHTYRVIMIGRARGHGQFCGDHFLLLLGDEAAVHEAVETTRMPAGVYRLLGQRKSDDGRKWITIARRDRKEKPREPRELQYRVWLDQTVNGHEYWSYERLDGKGSGGNFRTAEDATRWALNSLTGVPFDPENAKAFRRMRGIR
jgi:hypothetical protein